MSVFEIVVFLISPLSFISKIAEKVYLSSFGRREHNSLLILSGNMGFTLSGKYTDVARL